MISLRHPSSLLHPEWISLINDTASLSEAGGQLHPRLLELVYQQGWFKMMIPAAYGGLQKGLPEIVCLEEALSWADGSLGWVVTLCAGAGWFGGFLEPELAKSVFAKREACLAGSGASTGTAEVADGSYFVNGSWMYASGALHTTAFTANCVLVKNGQPLLDETGSPLIKTFIFDRKEVNVLHRWASVGLKGTGSHPFGVKELEVSAERCFELNASKRTIDSPLYRYPFLQLAEATLAANSSGMALRFIQLAGEIIAKRLNDDRFGSGPRKVLKQTLSSAVERMENIRTSFYKALEESWNKNEEGESSLDELAQVSMLSRKLARVSRQCVDDLYPYCGLAAADPAGTINRVWRDIHTASQHSLLTFLAN